ncbi:DUF6470 family protein [Cytobacillus gottheilii]|uniref:DUF6470 family protein n=1 Tax=Cytobacillus gottheilii TaxID=859144 RepID=UPI000834272B|nr:DUF6470 family protein [Cytobacillus gottheilii]
MNMPSLQVHQISAQLGINIYQPTMKMQQPQADMRIEQPAATLEINYKKSKLNIDQTEAFADIDQKSAARRTREWAEQGKQMLAQGVARRAREGDQMMMIENGSDAIARISKQNTSPPLKEIGLGFLPKTPFRVKIDYDPGNVDVNFTSSKPRIDVTANKPIMQHENWKADPYLRQKDSFEIEVVNFRMDQYV